MKYTSDYLARVEKAMTERYGKETVQDFRSEWSEEKENEYIEQSSRCVRRKKDAEEKITIGDGVVVSQRAATKRTQRTCPVCRTYSFSTKDDLYMARYESCYACYVNFIEGREDRWKTGWRPNKERLIALKGQN